jgi:hypothetical protein
MNQYFKTIGLTAILIFIAVSNGVAQGPGPPPVNNTPLDPASLSVLIGGGALALKKMRDKKKAKGL